jgi:hypothetical protein
VIDEQTRARLLQAKLAGIVRSRGGEPLEPTAVQGGAAVVGKDGGCWVLVQDDPLRGVGRALAWAIRHGGATPTCVVDVDPSGKPQSEAAAIAARRGAALAQPVAVWWVEGSTVHDAVPAEPEPSGPFVPSAAAAPWLDVASALETDIVVHADGAITFELLGLDIGRVSADGTLSVGAGRHDREATLEVWAGEPGREALARAAASIRVERCRDRIPTLASTLQRERWLRRSLLADPGPVGVDALVALPDPAPPLDLRRLRPAGAVSADGAVLVVCSVGADLDLVPTAADLRAMHAPTAERIVLAVPAGDDHRITRDLASMLPVPSEVVTVPAPWD